MGGARGALLALPQFWQGRSYDFNVCSHQKKRARRLKTTDSRDNQKRAATAPPFFCRDQFLAVAAVIFSVVIIAKVEQVEEIADGGAIARDVGIILAGDRIWEIVTAAVR
jgi:hypothetical protein